jgi:hypothetical protein
LGAEAETLRAVSLTCQGRRLDQRVSKPYYPEPNERSNAPEGLKND